MVILPNVRSVFCRVFCVKCKKEKNVEKSVDKKFDWCYTNKAVAMSGGNTEQVERPAGKSENFFKKVLTNAS